MRCFPALLAVVAALICANGNATQDNRPLRGAALDHRIEALMKAAQVPGLALALIENGQVTYLKAYGERDVARHLPLQTDTVMYAASLTKAAFSYSAMMLVDEGKLDLDRSIASDLPKPLPDYPKYADLANDPRWRQITPRFLLSHRGGFANYRYWPPGKDYDPNGKLAIYVDPGTRYSYSGEGINLLQFVLEHGNGVDVGDYMRTHLFTRFGMTRTALTWRDDFAANVALGYDEQGKPLPHAHRTQVRAAGSMDTTVHDYAQLAAAMVRGEGLKPATYANWLTPEIRIHDVQQFPVLTLPATTDNDGIALSYALGVGRFQSPQGPAWFKEGHDDGTNNLLLCLQRSRTCMLVLSNSSNAESIFPYLLQSTLGKTCFPWYWASYIPYDHPEWRSPAARAQPHSPCQPFESPL
ncbi:serine hydrolase domain-containing protein [Dyella acidiphila]|uniref:Beta-lactamase family protein n=1 Tax=Dyella acidiphila TaxID=2775866 RepID=A0ABR9GG35_9GAMM|nr:serine hydrolase domain-containing protein [Dyella acidiphila]MBE1163004.1 beta-lactamase family protein [Dyella acidiphila]